MPTSQTGSEKSHFVVHIYLTLPSASDQAYQFRNSETTISPTLSKVIITQTAANNARVN